MICIGCENITLEYGGDVILDRITFSLNEGDRLGIVGVNGAGKTSLFRVILGEEEAQGGVFIAKGKTIGVLYQINEFETGRTVYDEALYRAFPTLLEDEKKLTEMASDPARAEEYALFHEDFTRRGGYEFRGRTKGVLKSIGLPPELFDSPITVCSGGQKTMLALAALLLRAPDIILLDEPTNHLDTAALGWLEDYILSINKTVLVISHDRYFLDRCSTKILQIEHRRGTLYNGNYTTYAEKKKRDAEIYEHQYKNQQKEISRIEAYIEQQRRWNRERNIIAAESRQKQLDKMEKLDRPDSPEAAIRMRFQAAIESGEDVLNVRSLSKGYGGKALFSGAEFLIKKRSRVFILGRNGCGKSTLIKILAGKLAPDSGHVDYGSGVKVGYYDQENQQLNSESRVLDELWNSYENLSQTEIRSTLALFLFTGDDVMKSVSALSGGERARLTLAKLMLSRVNLLLLDEPTNHLDIPSREVLEDALAAYGGTVVAVSHDRYFIKKLADRILYFDGETVRDSMGGYEDYLTLRTAKSSEVTHASGDSRDEYLRKKREASEKKSAERKIERAREELSECEAEIDRIDSEIAEHPTDYDLLSSLYEKKEQVEEKMLGLMELLYS